MASSLPDSVPRRPVWKPGVRRLWRAGSTLQLESPSGDPTVLSGVDDDTLHFLDSLDGHAPVDALVSAASLDAESATHLLDRLAGCGLLDDAATASRPLRDLTITRRQLLAVELNAQAADAGAPGTGIKAFQSVRSASVTVHGAGRLGASIAMLLDASGVSGLQVNDDAIVDVSDVSPGGHRLVDVGRPRSMALRDRLSCAVRRRKRQVDVVVLAGEDSAARRTLAERLCAESVTHLHVTTQTGIATVGPLVVPGYTACHGCVDQHRADRDPGYPMVLAQRVGTCDPPATSVAVAVGAAVAVAQTVRHLGGLPSAAVDGVLTVHAGEGRLRRRSYPRHAACGCAWHEVAAS